jgi:hypothetical protein
LLVPLIGRLHAGDKEAACVLVGDYRAASRELDCAGKDVYCFAELDSIRSQELHPNSTRIRIGPPNQVNLVYGIERQCGGTGSALLDYRYQRSYGFAGSAKKLSKELRGVKICEHDQILVRCCVVGHARGERRAGKDVANDKRIR